MGPRSDERGNSPNGLHSELTNGAFNGAALRRARKLVVDVAQHWDVHAPSMGPRSDEREKLQTCDWDREPVDCLQWGRAQTSAETLPPTSSPIARKRLQWGRAQTSAETLFTLNMQ